MNPESPTFLFNYFDIFLLSLVILSNWLLIKRNSIKINWKIYTPFSICLFIVFPLLSIRVEVGNVYRKFEMVDGFNLWYTILRWPTWWLLGFIELIALKIIKEKKLDSQADARK